MLLALVVGCGKSVQKSATEQLLLSDAVDKSVSSIDFRVLSGEKVFFDTQYVTNVKSAGFVNSEYIISSLRQQLVAANCRLQDKKEEADFVVEARVGALGTDTHELIFGIPANNGLNAAASLVAEAPSLPAVPEISVAKKNDQMAAAKIGVFAYHRETRAPVWQSGMAQAKSDAKDVWFMGAGPFQSGAIYNGTQFAGGQFPLPGKDDGSITETHTVVDYQEQFNFRERSLPDLKLVAGESAGSAKVDTADATSEEDDADAKPAEPAKAEPAADAKAKDKGKAKDEVKPDAKEAKAEPTADDKDAPVPAEEAAAAAATPEAANGSAPPADAPPGRLGSDVDEGAQPMPAPQEPFFRLQTMVGTGWMPDMQAVGWLSRLNPPRSAEPEPSEPPGRVLIFDVPHQLQLFSVGDGATASAPSPGADEMQTPPLE